VAAVAVVAALFAVAGAVGLPRADDGLVRRIVVVDGVPLHEVRPANASGPLLPGVVVAHGFSGSARLMYPFADTFARNGYAVVLPDLTGHGANSRRMSTRDLLQRDLAVALRHLRSLESVAADRVALLGHSMGAAAVTSFAAADASVPATVAISLSDATGLPGGADRPRNLLLLYGAAEFPRFAEAADQALRLGYPHGQRGRTYGDPASGTARRAVAVPAAEHVSVLYQNRSHAEAVGWLDAVLRPGQPRASTVDPRRRLVPAGLLLLAFALGGYPVAVALFSRRRQARVPAQVPPAPSPAVWPPRSRWRWCWWRWYRPPGCRWPWAATWPGSSRSPVPACSWRGGWPAGRRASRGLPRPAGGSARASPPCCSRRTGPRRWRYPCIWA
jgi:dienelactone hydrolase